MVLPQTTWRREEKVGNQSEKRDWKMVQYGKERPGISDMSTHSNYASDSDDVYMRYVRSSPATLSIQD